MDILQMLPNVLLPWFYENKRDLPWRADTDAYHVWLSEIMLQQTRVEAVKAYYLRFLQQLPTLSDLAACDDERLNKLWEGLGYYSRVRNLKKTAQIVVERYGGEFPRDHDVLLSLPGIGAYTAGAVCSIAFGQKRAAVDGNVLRVYTRLLHDETPIDQAAFKSAVATRLEAVYPPQAGDFTQALMELGATVCGPNREARCDICPCRAFCRAHGANDVAHFPVKPTKKVKRQEQYTLFILEQEERFALCKRADDGLLASLWQFPNVEGLLDVRDALAWLQSQGIEVHDVDRQLEKKHIFTHIVWQMRGFYMRVSSCGDGFSWFTADEIEQNAALPTAFRQFWEARKE